MTRVDGGPLVRISLENVPGLGSNDSITFELYADTQATTSAATSTGSLVGTPPLSGRRSPADVYADTNVMTISQSGPITVSFDGENAGYNNSLVMVKLDDRGNVVDTVPVFPDTNDPNQSVELDVERGDRIAFMVVPNGGASEDTAALLADPDASLQLLNRQTGRPANLLTDNPADIGLFTCGCDGQRTEIQGDGGLTFSIKRDQNAQGPDGQGFNSAQISIDPATGQAAFRMEDLVNGDNDMDDLMFSVDLGMANAAALLSSAMSALPRNWRQFVGIDGKADLDEIIALLMAVDGIGTADADGEISPAEWARIARLLGMSPDDLAYFQDLGVTTIAELAQAILDEADMDGDGKVSRRELRDLKRVIDEVQGDDSLPTTFAELAGADRRVDLDELEALFDALDGSTGTNANGVISPAEWARAAGLLGMDRDDLAVFRELGYDSPEEIAQAIIEAADTNGDGVSRRELRDLKRAIDELQGDTAAASTVAAMTIAGMDQALDADEIDAVLSAGISSDLSAYAADPVAVELGNVTSILARLGTNYDFLNTVAASADSLGQMVVELADADGDGKVTETELSQLAEDLESMEEEAEAEET